MLFRMFSIFRRNLFGIETWHGDSICFTITPCEERKEPIRIFNVENKFGFLVIGDWVEKGGSDRNEPSLVRP